MSETHKQGLGHHANYLVATSFRGQKAGKTSQKESQSRSFDTSKTEGTIDVILVNKPRPEAPIDKSTS